MKHTEKELKELKTHHIEMWNLVQNQVSKAFDALRRADKELAREVIARERIVNAQELVVDHHCENFIALFAPVAIDLRFVIALLKITNNLERIGDFAKGIAGFVLYRQNKPMDADLFARLQLEAMMTTSEKMLQMAREALINEDSVLCGKVLNMDDSIDRINEQVVPVMADYISNNSVAIQETMYLYAVIRRIERIGDRVSNIAEDIVFFVDAKELRHQKK
ncbi:MAG: phosphate signaling complex protein PhoU [Lentimicrobiaceae bacterium]|jgi:phosphate transport system protein|nr:phosphate signaling complex protein PhoU [Lentimicrobiaceae bacterium]